jgi:hypothetical protein
MAIETKDLRRIFGVARERGITNEEIHEAIWMGFSKKSLKELTPKEIETLVAGMKKGRAVDPMGGAARRSAMASHGRRQPQAGAPNAEYLVRPAELRMLHQVAAARGWSAETLAAFCQRQIQVDTPRTMRELNKVLWAIKAMNRREGIAREA